MKQVSCDVLIAGSGAAGLACAFAARSMGLNVVVTEKASVIGGTTAWSGGEIWVPCNSYMPGAGIEDSRTAAIQYLQASAEGRADPTRISAYVDTAAEALDYFVSKGAMQVEIMADAPDYFDNLPGAHKGGRTLRMVPFDGRQLKQDFRKLRDPLLAGQIFGGLSVAREDIAHLQAMGRSARSLFYVGRLLFSHALQRMGGLHRGARTTMGNAMIARLYAKLREHNVPIWLSSPLSALQVSDGAVGGAVVATPDGPVEVIVRCGVVLATGGFSHEAARRAELYPHVARGQAHVALPPKEVAGEGIAIAMQAGGRLHGQTTDPAAWTTVSSRVSAQEALQVPHFGDKAKPGIIAVLQNGKRFANEASNYHDFCRALINVSKHAKEATAYLVADHRALRRYGLGRVGPFPSRLGPHLRCGYLFKGNSLQELAKQISVDVPTLAATVERFNVMAREGVDQEFQRGNSAFDRAAGDAAQHPNPCMAPLEQGPFYAIRIQPGNLSTFLGLDTDAEAAVRDDQATSIQGLYALGADAEAVTGGSYPAAGITLGPALTFAYIAARKMSAAGE
jgi:succinate dehydrogenase/fumarate reductase flavoprotein subunit